MTEIISTAPLEQGDPIGLDTFVGQPDALGGKPGDIVAIAVPVGKGLVFERWLRRQLLHGSHPAASDAAISTGDRDGRVWGTTGAPVPADEQGVAA